MQGSEGGQSPDAAKDLPGEEAAPVPQRRISKNQPSNEVPPPLPSREGRKKVSELFRQQSSSPPPPLPSRPKTLAVSLRNSEDPPPLPSRPRSEEGITVPTPPHRPFLKTPSSPLLRASLPQCSKVIKRSSGGEYIWVRPMGSPEGDTSEPPPIPPLPALSHQAEDCVSGAARPGHESCGKKQHRTGKLSQNTDYDYIIILDSPSDSSVPPLPARSHQSMEGTSTAGLPGPDSGGQEPPLPSMAIANLIYGCGAPPSTPPEPPPRQDSLLLDLQGDSPSLSSALASLEVPRAGEGNGALPKTSRLPTEVQEQDAPGPPTPPRGRSLENGAAPRTGSPARQHAATQVRRTF